MVFEWIVPSGINCCIFGAKEGGVCIGTTIRKGEKGVESSVPFGRAEQAVLSQERRGI